MATIKITELTSIGANLTSSTVIPVVNMSGTPTTEKTVLGNIANVVLTGAGNSYSPAGRAILAQSVTNAAQPNITSVGTLTNLAVSGNIAVNGNITSNGTAYVGNLSTTGLASITTLAVGATANLGAVANVTITGGTAGQVLTTNGSNVLSWTTVSGGNSSYGNSDVANYLPIFTGNIGANVVTANLFSGNGTNLTNIAGANVSGFVPNANVANTAFAVAGANVSGTVGNANLSQFIDVSSVNNNFSYHLVLSAGDGDKSIHIDADDNLQYNPADGTLTAVRVDATYVLADLQFSNGYPAANVTGLGNIAITNYDGNASNVLHGDGTWSADTTTYGNSNVVTLLSAFGSNTITTTGNVSVGNIVGNSTIDIDNRVSGNAADIRLFSADDIVLQARDRTLGSTSEGGDINLFAGDSAEDGDSSGGDVQIFAGDGGAGNIDFGGSGGFITIQSGQGGAATGSTGATAQSGGALTLSAGDAGDNNGNIELGAAGGAVFIESGYSTGGGDYGGEIVLTTGTGGQNAASGNVRIVIPGYGLTTGGTWKFDGTGNLTLPGNTFAVNYANGSPVVISGGGANTGNITFDDITVQGVNGLNLSAGADFTANLAYLQVRAGDVASHIHLDTGNNEAYDLIVGDDQNYVQVSSTGNILLSSYDSNTAQYTWTLDYNGNLILAGGNSVIQSIANSSLDILNPNVSTMVLTPDPGYYSQSLVLDPTAPGHIHLRSPGSNIDQPSANLFLGGEASSFEVGQYNGAVPNLFIHSNNNTWTFDIDGNLTLPQLTTISDESGIGTTLTVGVPPTVIVISGADFSAVNTTYTKTSAATPTWEPAGYNPATDPYIEFSGGEYGIFAPSFGQALYVNTGTLNKPLTQWNINPPLGSVAPTAVYTYGAPGPDWVFGADGNLNFPRDVAGNSDPYLNIFGGSTPTIQSTDVSLAGPANLAIQSDYLNLSGSTGNRIILQADAGAIATDAAMVLSTNLADLGNVYSWTFGADGILTVPGDLVAVSASPAPSISGFSSVSALAFTNGNSNVTVNANSNLWNFDSTGNLTIPGSSGGFIKTVSNASIGIAAMDNGTNNPAQLLSLNVGTGAATSIVSAYATNVAIQTNAAGAINTWAFDNAGNLTLPGNTVTINFANGSAAFGNMVQWTTAPIANTSAGAAGQAAYDSGGNLYVCVSANTWAKFTGTTSW